MIETCRTFARLIIVFLILASTGLSAQSVRITEPFPRAIFQQVDGVADIQVRACAGNLPLGGGVQFILNAGTSRSVYANDFSPPYAAVFPSVGLGEHSVEAYVIDQYARRLPVCDRVLRIGVGDIIVAVGDSITAGDVDDVHTDDFSSDGRNGPRFDIYPKDEVYGGYEPILNDLLTKSRGYPQSVINRGYPGDMASEAIPRIDGVIAEFPTARTWILAFGTNDSNHAIGAHGFAANVQTLVDRIQSAIPGAVVYLPKVFYWDSWRVPGYHHVMGDITRNTPNVRWGADLQTLFQANHQLYDHRSGEYGTWLARTLRHTTQTA